MKRTKIINCDLKKWREKRHWTQNDLATILGWKYQTPISRWENGVVIPKVDTALLIAKFLNCKVEDLWQPFAELPKEIR